MEGEEAVCTRVVGGSGREDVGEADVSWEESGGCKDSRWTWCKRLRLPSRCFPEISSWPLVWTNLDVGRGKISCLGPGFLCRLRKGSGPSLGSEIFGLCSIPHCPKTDPALQKHKVLLIFYSEYLKFDMLVAKVGIFEADRLKRISFDFQPRMF